MEIEMYVIESHNGYRVLHDYTKGEIDSWMAIYRDDPVRTFKIVSGQIAHKWVRDGGLHTTGLYVDGNFIRKAKSLN
jgi:hypothetical protein